MKKYITKQSSIKGAGKGLFTNASFKKGEVIGLAHVDGQPTKEIGSNHNHNEKNPTANNIKNGNKRYLIASKNLNPGEEITTNYRLQPELEQPEDFKKKKGGSMTPQKDGYRTYSPFKNLPYIDVKSNTIDSNNIVYDLKLKANNGLTKFIEKNTGLHTLPGAKVIREIPIKRKGGAVLKMPNKKNSKGYSRSLSATNKLFTQNFLFAKPKSRKNKVFDPNSKYYAEGGSLLTKKVTCKKCGWKWDAEDGGKDITTCHECGGQGLVHAQDGGLNKFVGGGNPCPEGFEYINGNCVKKSSLENCDDGRCEETDQIQKILDEGSYIPKKNVNIMWDVAQTTGGYDNAKKIWTDKGAQVISKRLGNTPAITTVGNCMWSAGLGYQCLPETKGKIPLMPFESNDKFINAVSKGTIPFSRVAKTHDPNFASKETGMLREGDIINFKGAGNSHAMTFSNYDVDGTPIFLDSNGQESNFGWNRGMWNSIIPNKEKVAYVSRFNPEKFYEKDIKVLEEKARTNPTMIEKQYGGISNDYIEADLDEDEIEEYRKGGYVVEEIDNYADGGEKNKCENGEYWNGKKCVPNSIMQKPSWNQEPVVNPAAYVSGYRGGNPRMSKYSFLNSDQGNIIGGGGLSFPKSGVHLNALGVVPVSSNDRQYFKGAYEANISKDFKNLNLGLGVNTAITGYPGENGFVKDPIKLQPKLNLRYNFQNGGIYNVKGSKGNYKKVNGQWQVDWNRSGNYQPLSKGDIKARTAVLDKMAKPVDDGMSKVLSNSSDNTKVNYQKPLVNSFNKNVDLKSFFEKEKDLQKQKDATAYHNKTNKISDNFTPKAKENLKNSPVIDNKYFINSQRNPIFLDGYKPEDTKLQSGRISMFYPGKYVIGPGGGLVGLGMKAAKAAFAFKPISYLPSVGKALTYHSVYDATTEHIPNTVKLLSDKSKWNNDKSVELFKNLFKITSTAAGFSKYDKLKHFNRARNVGQLIDKGTDANKDALKGTKMLKNFVTTFKKYGGQQF